LRARADFCSVYAELKFKYPKSCLLAFDFI
jgi:hypothetical protein